MLIEGHHFCKHSLYIVFLSSVLKTVSHLRWGNVVNFVYNVILQILL